MSRAGTRQASPAPVAISPFAYKVVLAILAAGGVALVVFAFEKINGPIQIERRLQQDPRLSAWLGAVKHEVNSPGTAGAKTACAVWLGTVDYGAESKPHGSQPELMSVYLRKPRLLAGEAQRGETRGSVHISLVGHSFSDGKPRKGEQWLFAVWRDQKNNFVRDAVLYQRAP